MNLSWQQRTYILDRLKEITPNKKARRRLMRDLVSGRVAREVAMVQNHPILRKEVEDGLRQGQETQVTR